MLEIRRTTAADSDFQELVVLLDAHLKQRDGDEHTFFSQFNKTDDNMKVVLAYQGTEAVGCGALRKYAEAVAEVKRMYVRPAHRGKGIAATVLAELELWAGELSFVSCVLETGDKFPEAVALYLKNGYHEIPNYGPYQGVVGSICFEKHLGGAQAAR